MSSVILVTAATQNLAIAEVVEVVTIYFNCIGFGWNAVYHVDSNTSPIRPSA